MSSDLPCGTPSTMSTRTTSASSLSAIPCATVAPTLPAPTTVTFVFMAADSIANAFRLHGDGKRHRRDDEEERERADSGGVSRARSTTLRWSARRCFSPARRSRGARSAWPASAARPSATRSPRPAGARREEVWARVAEVRGRRRHGRGVVSRRPVARHHAGRARRVLRSHRRDAGRDGEEGRARRSCFRKVDAQGARYVVKILTRELRIGLVEGLVESAIAKAFGREARRRCGSANMFTGDIGATALLAKSDALETAKMSLFHPFAFMLAQPEEDPAEIVAALGAGAIADDKYDGIRAQIHTDGSEVRIYSRTLDNVTHRFPEIEAAARDARPQRDPRRRDRRVQRSHPAVRDHPEAPRAQEGEREAAARTRRWCSSRSTCSISMASRCSRCRCASGWTQTARAIVPTGSSAIRLGRTQTPIRDAAHVDELFDAARARANEGLVVKDPESIYTPGRRGKSWLKYKKALATLDCVVTYAQYGNGKRRGVLSDLTFAVRRGRRAGEHRQGLLGPDRRRDRRDDGALQGHDDRAPRPGAPRRADGRAGDRVRPHPGVVAPQVGLRAAFSAHRAHPRRQDRRPDLNHRRSSPYLRRTTAPRGAGRRRLRPMPLYRSRRNSMIAGVCGGHRRMARLEPDAGCACSTS